MTGFVHRRGIKYTGDNEVHVIVAIVVVPVTSNLALIARNRSTQGTLTGLDISAKMFCLP